MKGKSEMREEKGWYRKAEEVRERERGGGRRRRNVK